MKLKSSALFGTAVGTLLLAFLPSLSFGTTTAIFGSGNPNFEDTLATTATTETAFRWKNRSTGATPDDGLGTYTFALGENANFEFSFNSNTTGGGSFLTGYTALLGIDNNPFADQTNFIIFNPFTFYVDNSFGTNATANGGGAEGLFAAFAGSTNIVQNSQREMWYGIDRMIDGTYDGFFTVYDPQGAVVSTINTKLVFGQGGATVPDAANSSLLLGIALLALGAYRRSHVRRSA